MMCRKCAVQMGTIGLLLTFFLTATAAKAETDTAALLERIERLEQEVARANDRDAIQNLFSRYQYLHNAFEDEKIIPLWAKKGTPGIRAQYSNLGVYNTWESITQYHRGRPRPVGKLLLHYVTTPLIEVAADGKTAKGLWVVSGIESGLTDAEVAEKAPEYMYEKAVVDGKKVWMHTVFVKYGIDFIKQDGEWKIWHFHCFEVARSPHGMGWIPFAAAAQDESFNFDLMYFGDNGAPVFMPKPDAPATIKSNSYRTDTSQYLEARPPEPYTTFSETFEY